MQFCADPAFVGDATCVRENLFDLFYRNFCSANRMKFHLCLFKQITIYIYIYIYREKYYSFAIVREIYSDLVFVSL